MSRLRDFVSYGKKKRTDENTVAMEQGPQYPQQPGTQGMNTYNAPNAVPATAYGYHAGSVNPAIAQRNIAQRYKNPFTEIIERMRRMRG
jgi:hypothetical protein